MDNHQWKIRWFFGEKPSFYGVIDRTKVNSRGTVLVFSQFNGEFSVGKKAVLYTGKFQEIHTTIIVSSEFNEKQELEIILRGVVHTDVEKNSFVLPASVKPREIPIISGNSFIIRKYLVTIEEWLEYCREKNISIQKWENLDPGIPIHNISWMEGIRFCDWVSAKCGLSRCFDKFTGNFTDKAYPGSGGYRFLTQTEWELAAGYKASKDFTFSGSDDSDSVGWYCENTDSIRPVGLKKPNAAGIYDMSGNVWEFLWDFNNDNERMIKGGSYSDFSQLAENNRNKYWSQSIPLLTGGLRLAREYKWIKLFQ